MKQYIIKIIMSFEGVDTVRFSSGENGFRLTKNLYNAKIFKDKESMLNQLTIINDTPVIQNLRRTGVNGVELCPMVQLVGNDKWINCDIDDAVDFLSVL